MTGGKTVAQLCRSGRQDAVRGARRAQCAAREADGGLVVLDVREKDRTPRPRAGARHLPRGQLELRINDELKDPTRGSSPSASSARSRRSPPRRSASSASCARPRSMAHEGVARRGFPVETSA